jgi:prophage DNA circulation protein
MYIGDVNEAVPICDRVLGYMLAITATRGRVGADMRTAIGDFLANAATLLSNDLAGPPLADIFDKSLLAGITLTQLDAVRANAVTEAPKSVGALLIKNALINFTLVVEARVIAQTTFVSHEDANAMKLRMNDAFAPMEEIAADDMDQMTYQALVRLHAAITFFLIETARPLPQMLGFQFYSPSIPTLIAAYRLYADASRADELRAENRVVHPAFMRPSGKALSN